MNSVSNICTYALHDMYETNYEWNENEHDFYLWFKQLSCYDLDLDEILSNAPGGVRPKVD